MTKRIEKLLSVTLSTIFPSFQAVGKVIESASSPVVSKEGLNLLSDPDKLRMLSERIKESEEGQREILVEFQE